MPVVLPLTIAPATVSEPPVRLSAAVVPPFRALELLPSVMLVVVLPIFTTPPEMLTVPFTVLAAKLEELLATVRPVAPMVTVPPPRFKVPSTGR